MIFAVGPLGYIEPGSRQVMGLHGSRAPGPWPGPLAGCPTNGAMSQAIWIAWIRYASPTATRSASDRRAPRTSGGSDASGAPPRLDRRANRSALFLGRSKGRLPERPGDRFHSLHQGPRPDQFDGG